MYTGVELSIQSYWFFILSAVLLFFLGCWWAIPREEKKKEYPIDPATGLTADKLRFTLSDHLIHPHKEALAHFKAGTLTAAEIAQFKAVQLLRDSGFFAADIKRLVCADSAEAEARVLAETDSSAQLAYRETPALREAAALLRQSMGDEKAAMLSEVSESNVSAKWVPLIFVFCALIGGLALSRNVFYGDGAQVFSVYLAVTAGVAAVALVVTFLRRKLKAK